MMMLMKKLFFLFMMLATATPIPHVEAHYLFLRSMMASLTCCDV